MAEDNGLLFVVSGPAGSGKTTIVERLLALNPPVRRAVTATTRSPRSGEQDKVDYFFLSREDFQAGIEKGRFIEYTIFNGNYYGTPKKELEDNLSRGGVVVLVIEVDGAESIRFFFPHAVTIFVIPPSPEHLEARLRGRGTDSEADIANRLKIARRELQRLDEYDFLIVNDDPDTAAGDLAAIIGVMRRSRITGGELEKWFSGYFTEGAGDTAARQET